MLILVSQSRAQFFKLGLVWNTDTEVFNKLEIVVIYFYFSLLCTSPFLHNIEKRLYL